MPPKILVVDDEEDTAILVSECLCRRGYDATYVTSASQCLARMDTDHVDLVVTDVQMPGMSGIELCEQLRELHPECPSIVLTGNGSGDIANAASRAGAYVLLTKPAKIDALDSAITSALEHHP